MTSRIGDIVIKAQDPDRLSRFWCAALGYTVSALDETGVAISGASNAPTILFERSDDTLAEGTLHFDLCPTDRSQSEELDRLVSLGAKPTEVVPSGGWHVLADPEGNKFCLMSKRIPAEPEDFHDLGPAQTVTDADIEYAVLKTTGQMPETEEVRDLYAAAATEPPLNETLQTAQVFADLFRIALKRNDVVAVSARQQGRLVAFAYGHPWRWKEQNDEWANDLKTRLGGEASTIDETIALFLLARDPSVQRRGLGQRVLKEWLDAAEHESVWLQTTDIDTPAQRLYRSVGFKAIGHGPKAPNNAPSLVMLKS